jgi:hypothetical protein
VSDGNRIGFTSAGAGGSGKLYAGFLNGSCVFLISWEFRPWTGADILAARKAVPRCALR